MQVIDSLLSIWKWIVCREWAVIVALITLLVAVLGLVVSRRQDRRSQRGLLNDRYQKSTELLGNRALSVRLTAINELQSLAKEEPEQYQLRIMMLLCDFVSHPTEHDNTLPSERLRKDVQEAMKVIVTLRGDAEIKLRLVGAKLPGAILIRKNLARCNPDWRKPTRCKLSPHKPSRCNPRRCKPKRRKPGRRKLGSRTPDRHKPDRRKLDQSNLVHAHLDGSHLAGEHLNDAKGAGVKLDGTYLGSANLTDANLGHADLTDANLVRANLTDANLVRANLTGANLIRANLSRINLANALLILTDLTGANLSRANLTDAFLILTNLTGANLSHAKGLTQAQLDQACADPDNLPNLSGLRDAETDLPLEWRGKPCS